MAQINVTGVLTQEMMTYYEKVFLERAKVQLVNEQGAVKRTHPQNSGKTINFTRLSPLTISTTALAEASNPSASAITASTVAVTLAEYGATTINSRLISLTSIDQGMKEMVDAFGQNMGETLNAVAGNELACATAFFNNGHNVSTVVAGDVLNASACRWMVQTLEVNRAQTYPDGVYLGKTTPQNKVGLLGDTTWVAAHTYRDTKELYKGEMGELYQIRFLLNGQVVSGTGSASDAACTVVQYYTYVHGQNAFGTVNLEGDMPKLYIVNTPDSGNVAGRLTYISWAGAYAAKLLNSNWALTGKFPMG
jgi:N4-gp56 family major capsid protein